MRINTMAEARQRAQHPLPAGMNARQSRCTLEFG
jgi:hypothetical protein